jgi:hypothetical protein
MLLGMLLWMLAVGHGVEVGWVLEGLEVHIQKLETVCDQAGREEQFVHELAQLRVRVRQWMSTATTFSRSSLISEIPVSMRRSA